MKALGVNSLAENRNNERITRRELASLLDNIVKPFELPIPKIWD